MVVRYDSSKLGEVPGVPLFDSHGESVDIFIQKFEQTDGLNDGLVLPVDVERDFITGEGVGETQSGLL